ncbi:DUF1266 domain-containing protein [Streptomyces sp. NPDC057445]|uniref:DUF1266 domain-containing protein n=1 Tax=Streptomyces sp. NPDC057445 TaxID=3346136 RepID=UPI0036A68802
MTTGTTAWAPPTETEQLLYEAREAREASASGVRGAELAVLSRAPLFLTLPRLHADTPGFRALPASVKDPETGKPSLPVFTAGMLPPWNPEWVHRSVTLAELAQEWPNDRWRLAVNPGSPCAITLEARRSHRQAWLRAAADTGGPRRGLLVTHTGGPLQGSLAHGLACGAHLSVHNSVAWNELGTTYFDYFRDAATLRGIWRVTNRAGFLDKLDALCNAMLCGREEAIALTARTGLTDRLGRSPSHEEWLDAVTRALLVRRADTETVEEVRATAGRIACYEERFRADGVLGAGERVDSLSAFDYGRIVAFVRMALGARLCAPQEAEQAVLTAGRLSRQRYASWGAFSAAYSLARVLAFDEDEFGQTYQESVAQHRILTQDQKSPCRSVPWS